METATMQMVKNYQVFGCWVKHPGNHRCELCGAPLVEVPQEGHYNSRFWIHFIPRTGERLACCPNGCPENDFNDLVEARRNQDAYQDLRAARGCLLHTLDHLRREVISGGTVPGFMRDPILAVALPAIEDLDKLKIDSSAADDRIKELIEKYGKRGAAFLWLREEEEAGRAPRIAPTRDYRDPFDLGGWIDPDGRYYQCLRAGGHRDITHSAANLEEREAEKRGWIKVYLYNGWQLDTQRALNQEQLNTAYDWAHHGDSPDPGRSVAFDTLMKHAD